MLFDKTCVMLYYNIVMLRYITCHVMLYNIWSFHVMTYVVVLCYITYAVSCYVI